MEHTLGVNDKEDRMKLGFKVLILVLMEHTLGVQRLARLYGFVFVLILVLMEHTLGVL